ncbi:MAG: methyltransferase domain-containing protein [Bacteroidales bacterium]|jgi:DNA modification methylase|nr:methyltransferase domain-containing protein [Bacteroidales bacterium]
MNKHPNSFKPEITTVWSFPERGAWATHNPKYRGNWAPQIPRNLILKYTKEQDLVLDPMVGAGTTLIEAKLLNRNAIGIDINPSAVKLTKENLLFDMDNKSRQEIFNGDIRDLSKFKDNTFDLIATHPPYLNIIKYSDGKITKDLSNIGGITKFSEEFRPAVKEMYRILKSNKYCAILIGDTRRRKHYVPFAYRIMDLFLSEGFILKEDIIKTQHNCKTTPRWRKMIEDYDFYLIMHEHLFVFRKPAKNEDLSIFSASRN